MLISIGGASAIVTWAPVAAPLFVGQLTESFGWRSVYFAMAAYGGLGATCVLLTPSHPRHRSYSTVDSYRLAGCMRYAYRSGCRLWFGCTGTGVA